MMEVPLKHLSLGFLLLSALTLNAMAAAPSVSCKVKCVKTGDITEQDSESFDKCVDFAAQSGCLKVEFTYTGDPKTRQTFFSVMKGEIRFTDYQGHKIKLTSSEIGRN
jgi:hypothetical protein